MIGRVLGIGRAARDVGAAVGGVAEIFAGNRAARDAAEHERYVRVLAQFGEEFSHPATRPFDAFVNGINRLPRPLMALGTMGLFSYSMVEPEGFALRMQGLALVPEPLWWLLGAIVGFYFGARELHHYRCRSGGAVAERYDGAADAFRPVGSPVSPPPQAARRVEAAPAPAALAAPGSQASPSPAPAVPLKAVAQATSAPAIGATRRDDPDYNAAFEEWRAQRA